jgi:hypothetical protein
MAMEIEGTTFGTITIDGRQKVPSRRSLGLSVIPSLPATPVGSTPHLPHKNGPVARSIATIDRRAPQLKIAFDVVIQRSASTIQAAAAMSWWRRSAWTGPATNMSSY